MSCNHSAIANNLKLLFVKLVVTLTAGLESLKRKKWIALIDFSDGELMTHNPTIKQLHYLCALADSRHFGKAASHCHVSQSTLSAGILELEQSLGISLVERARHKVMLTPLGQEVVERSRKVLNQVEDIVTLCETSQEPFTGKMRLGVIPTIAPFMLPELLQNLRRQFPDFQLFIKEDLSAPLLEALYAGELDVLLLALPYPAQNCVSKHLFYDAFYLACPEQHPLAVKKNLTTDDLKSQDLLLLEDGHCLRDHALEACRLKTNEVTMPFQATSINTIVQMVANHIGITLLPAMALHSQLLAGTSVVVRAFDETNVQRSIGMMWRQGCPRQQEFNQLALLMIQQFGKLYGSA